MKIPKAPVIEKPPSPAQIAKAAARRGEQPTSTTPAPRPAYDRAALAEKVDAIMKAPRKATKSRKRK